MPLLDASEWKLVGNPLDIPRPQSGLLRRVVGDTAIDAAKGVVGLGQSAVGLADLGTAGLAGDALKYIGYDPEATDQWLSQFYSTQRQEAEQEVQGAEGFTGKIGALATNPSALIGRGVQSAPMLLGSMGAANRVYQATNSLSKATAAGHIAEGAMTAGSVAQDIRNQGGDRADMYWAVPAGAATAAIGYGAGRLMPEGQIESLLVPGARALTSSGKPVGLLRRTGTSAFSEGVLEEMPQSAQEQMFTNIGTHKPWMQGVPEAAGEGLMVGGATGGVLGPFQRRPHQPAQLLPGANQNIAPPPAPPLTPVQPRLDPYANYGETGTLFGSQPDLTTPTPEAPPDAYRDLMSDLAHLRQMAFEAKAAGDTSQLYAINQAMGQIATQLAALGENGLNQKRLFDTGIYEMVGNTPYELTGDQAAAGGLPTLEGEMEPVPQDTRLAEIRYALTQANGGKTNAQLLRFIPEFRAALDQGPDAVQAVLSKYDNKRSTLRPEVLETADQLAGIYRTQDVNGMAMQGLANARPGAQVGAAPVSNATEQEMRARNAGAQAADTRAAQRQQFTGAIADTDARVQGAREQQTAAGRRQVLDSVLEGAANVGNARNRFIKALRKAGFRDTIIRPDEQASIDRYFGAREAFVEQDPDVLPSAPNEMGDAVPQKQEREAPKPGKPQRTNENRSFRLTSPPSTDADVAAQEKARAKRQRKAESQESQEPPPSSEGSTEGKQGILFTKKGQPSAQADQERPAPKPRKAKVKAKVGEQEVELEVDNADEKIAAMKKDIDKYEAFVACLRKK